MHSHASFTPKIILICTTLRTIVNVHRIIFGAAVSLHSYPTEEYAVWLLLVWLFLSRLVMAKPRRIWYLRDGYSSVFPFSCRSTLRYAYIANLGFGKLQMRAFIRLAPNFIACSVLVQLSFIRRSVPFIRSSVPFTIAPPSFYTSVTRVLLFIFEATKYTISNCKGSKNLS